MERLRACDLAVYRFLRGSSAGLTHSMPPGAMSEPGHPLRDLRSTRNGRALSGTPTLITASGAAAPQQAEAQHRIGADPQVRTGTLLASLWAVAGPSANFSKIPIALATKRCFAA